MDRVAVCGRQGPLVAITSDEKYGRILYKFLASIKNPSVHRWQDPLMECNIHVISGPPRPYD